MKTRYNEFSVAWAVRRLAAGHSLLEVSRSVAVPEKVVRAWAKKFISMSPSEVREATNLRQENRLLRNQIRLLRKGGRGGLARPSDRRPSTYNSYR